MRSTFCVLSLCLIACGGSSPNANAPTNESAAPAAAPANGDATQAPPTEAAASQATQPATPGTSPEAAGTKATSAPKSEAAAPAAQLPKECAARDGDTCMFSSEFVEKLCSHHHPDIALALFAKDTPWTRMFMRANVDAWYTGAGSSPRAKLAFDEEVLVLRFRPPPKQGIIVGDPGGSYDVMRWDGYCYSLEAGELTKRRPPKIKTSSVNFLRLAASMQDGLLADTTVKSAYDKRQKECGGATSGDVSQACVRADNALSSAIIEHVRSGKPVPETKGL